MSKIKIVDEPMGRGKTNAAIEYLQEEGNRQKVVYATPFLNEIERIKADCGFMQEPKPVSSEGKRGSFMWLAEKGLPIATTHALLENTLGISELAKLKEFNYKTLILDEALQAFNCVKEHTKDFKAIVSAGYVTIGDDGLLNFGDYDGNLLNNKEKISKIRNVYLPDNLESYRTKKLPLITAILTELWGCFEEIWILTYRFQHSDLRAYFDLYNMPYEYWHLEDGHFKEGYRSNDIEMPEIDIYEGGMNVIGAGKYALSKSWYKKNPDKLTILKNMTNNYIRNEKRARSNHVCWTTFKKYKNALRNNGYKKAFMSCNMRATNDFQDRTVVAYMVNRFLNPAIKRFLINKGIEFEEDQMMLNEMLQFLFRTALRKNAPISLYCPSSRMRTLLKEFIKKTPAIALEFIQQKISAIQSLHNTNKKEA